MTDTTVSSYASMFKLLADEKRLHMLRYLQISGLCVCDLEVLLDISQPSASQHLRKLKAEGMITSHRHDQWQIYSINEAYPLYSMLRAVLEELPSAKKDVDELTEKGLRSRCSMQEIEIKLPEKAEAK
ncbi:ArsR/SmtB family transcription factor [Alkalicoccus chagannorensis]|uniref:ArsR/SmtB family transcription factor n=1 Tax=Alkalicoccus chagannorensis TaxID=427072 RepID=UPI00042A045A|nr:metalloregulator ArsR/SmtB family transcription factor [Alkalicoccus chagannorensis]